MTNREQVQQMMAENLAKQLNVNSTTTNDTNAQVKEETSPVVKATDEDGNSTTIPTAEKLIDDRFSVEYMKQNYLFGLDLSDNSGKPFPESLFYHHLNAAIQRVARLLNIVITPTDIEETHDYYSTDFANWGYISLYKKPAISVSDMTLRYGSKTKTVIPKDWLKLTKLSSTLQLFPQEGSANSLIILGDGRLLQLPEYWEAAPQLWLVHYRAGFEGEIPIDLLDYIYKLAACNVLTIWGDLVLGPGISSTALSIDGLSQSINSTKSTTYNAASARILHYKQDMDDALTILKSTYDMRMSVV